MKDISTFVIAFVGGLIPELTLSYIVMKFMEEGWWVFWVTYIAIQVFYLIVWFFRSIMNWLLFIAFWKRQMVKEIYESLIRMRYPNKGYLYDIGAAETFFEDIVYEPQLQAKQESMLVAFVLGLAYYVIWEISKVFSVSEKRL